LIRNSDQAEAHRAKNKAARERRANRVAAKKEEALAKYSAEADKIAAKATAAK
jgi:hypothetical protein